MVDVGEKKVTHRIAIAAGRITMQEHTLHMILERGHKKGDVLGIARVAGIMAAKRTSDLVPLCHPIPINKVAIDLKPDKKTNGQTGVEMEALTAVQIALLTIYDKCKAVDRGMVLSDIRLLEKSGGKSGNWKRPT